MKKEEMLRAASFFFFALSEHGSPDLLYRHIGKSLNSFEKMEIDT